MTQVDQAINIDDMSNMFMRLFRRSETEQPEGARPAILPPARPAVGSSPMGISMVFRGVQILVTAAGQLSLDVLRGGSQLTAQPSFIRRPDSDISRSQWLAEVVASLALNGNAFLHKVTGPDGSILNIKVLPADQVAVMKNQRGGREFFYDGKTYTPTEVEHLKFLPLAGAARGLGPISQARQEVAAIADLRDFAAQVFVANDVPSGVLKTDQVLTEEMVDATKKRWMDTADGKVRVLGNGFQYSATLLSPADAQFIESKQMSTTDIARLLGVPASLMLAAIEGKSGTYQNVEQEWIAFTRFTLMAYLKPIEDALTEILNIHGQTVRFNLEALLRSDTASRYGAHKIGIDSGFLTVNEARGHEGLDPLPEPRHALPAKETETA